MIQIVAFLMEHFPDIQACPEAMALGMMLEDAGFEDDDIGRILGMIQLLRDYQEAAVFSVQDDGGSADFRIYHPNEAEILGVEIMGFLHLITASGALNLAQRELVIHALMYFPTEEVSLDAAKTLVLLVLWAQHLEVPELIDKELITLLHGNKTIM